VSGALESLLHFLFVENGIKDLVHLDTKLTREDGGEFFEVFAF
jgi:hypothetical protein